MTMVSPEEQKDAAATTAKVAENAVNCLSACRNLIGLTPEQLGYRGYKTEAEAVLGTVKRYLKLQDALWKDFFKRWPDK